MHIFPLAVALALAFFEETLFHGWGQKFYVSQEVFQEKTELQEVVIFENPLFGRVLALDGVIQLTEADEPIYHEMMTHVPLLSHPHPSSVLVLGGGDGGILREVAKHAAVKRMVLVEIDPDVISLSKKYFPKLSDGVFDDPRLEVIIGDAALFVKFSEELFDVILCDSTDPFGPGAVLFTSEFYGDCKARLKEGGLFVNQNGVPFLQGEEMTLTLNNRSPHFAQLGFYVAPIPTYAGGGMAFGWASDLTLPFEAIREEPFVQTLFYYNREIHKASFALPNYMLRKKPIPSEDP